MVETCNSWGMKEVISPSLYTCAIFNSHSIKIPQNKVCWITLATSSKVYIIYKRWIYSGQKHISHCGTKAGRWSSWADINKNSDREETKIARYLWEEDLNVNVIVTVWDQFFNVALGTITRSDPLVLHAGVITWMSHDQSVTGASSPLYPGENLGLKSSCRR